MEYLTFSSQTEPVSSFPHDAFNMQTLDCIPEIRLLEFLLHPASKPDGPQHIELYRVHSVDYQRLRDLIKCVDSQSAANSVKSVRRQHSKEVNSGHVETCLGEKAVDVSPLSGWRSRSNSSRDCSRENAFEVAFKLELRNVEELYDRRMRHLRANLDNQDRDVKRMLSNKKSEDEDVTFANGTEEELYAKKQYRKRYRELLFLQSFCRLNCFVLSKLAAAYDARAGVQLWASTLRPKLETLHFFRAEALQELLVRTEKNCASFFFDDDVSLARHSLLTPTREDELDWDLFSLGKRFGMVSILAIWVLWETSFRTELHPRTRFWYSNILPIYRCLACLVLGPWLWTFNLWVWTQSSVDYSYLLGLDPAHVNSVRSSFRMACNHSLVFLINFLVYYKVKPYDDHFVYFQADVIPACLLVYFMGQLLYLLRPDEDFGNAFFRTLTAPFHKVSFLDGLMGDILTSLVRVNTDIAFSLCWLFSGDLVQDEKDHAPSKCIDSVIFNKVVVPLIVALPLWFRLGQSLRQYWDTRSKVFFANAGKYAVAESVVMWGIFHKNFTGSRRMYVLVYMFFLSFSTLYSFFWDVLMDWDLGHRKWSYLRRTLMYPSVWIYYAAMVLDLALRFTWSLTLIPVAASSPMPPWAMEIITPMLAVLEILRRSFWSLLRIEHEHLKMSKKMRKNMSYRRLDFMTTEKLTESQVKIEAVSLALVVLLMGFAAYVTT
eukprot:gb/GEZN01002963.1/.p1 GENE.gb/GEZN01002963.1/~~gb/GEZN01002963.1/.p1  ORF type:complete len:717 (-),score=86.45 gb/GEZN01002963.1/:127-2277(-)